LNYERMWNELKHELHLRHEHTNVEIGKKICVYFLNLMERIEEANHI